MSSPLRELSEAETPGQLGDGSTRKPWLRRCLSAAGWGAFILALFFIWPTTLGGATSYVIVTGHSMEPTLHRGDFVVLRAGEYEVGDVVSYLPFDDIPAQVIHRIIGFREDGTVILQGDNNSFIDPYSPEVADIAGKMVFTVPTVGNAAWFLGHPVVWGSLGLLSAALLVWHRPSSTNETAEEGTDETQIS